MISKRFIGMFCIVMLLSSCIGVNADMVVQANGSGSITLEYHVSQFLESLGKLDGNENWPLIPVGRADFAGGRLVGIVRLRTKTTEFFSLLHYLMRTHP